MDIKSLFELLDSTGVVEEVVCSLHEVQGILVEAKVLRKPHIVDLFSEVRQLLLSAILLTKFDKPSYLLLAEDHPVVHADLIEFLDRNATFLKHITLE